MEPFKVKTGEFEGPMDLLLDLIEKRKLPINEVSLSQVTDDYIAYINSNDERTIPGMAHFVLVASTLLLIKSKALLPTLSLTEDEKGDIKNLEDRLKIYQRMKELSVHVKERFGKTILFEHEGLTDVPVIFSPDETVTTEGLLASIKRAIESIPVKELLPQTIVKKVISLEEMIGNLVERVKQNVELSFKSFVGEHKGEKVSVIVGFLAMLELVKQGSVSVVQNEHFGDITIGTQEFGTPSY